MTEQAAHDPALIDRLVAEAREAAGLLEKPLPDCTCTGWYSNPDGEHELNCVRGRHDAAVFKATRRAQFSAMADQLEAAKREVDRLRSANGEWAQIASDGLAERDALRAEVERMRPVVAAADAWRDAIDDTEGPADGDAIPGAAIALSDSVDAYRSSGDSSSAPHDSPCASPED